MKCWSHLEYLGLFILTVTKRSRHCVTFQISAVKDTTTSFPVAAGHVPPRIWVVTKNSLKGGRFRLLLSILSLQESVKCCHQNKHFFHVAPVCYITVMSQCNTVQTPKILYGGQNFVEEQPSLRFWFVTQIT